MVSSRVHLVGLDGLRGLAAASVLCYHVSNVLSPDIHRRAPLLVDLLHQGLTLFFVLSGFLLFLGFAERLIDGRPLPGLRQYAFSRILRIWPAYLVILLVTDVVFGLSFVRPRGVGRLSVGELVMDATLLHSYQPSTLRTGLEVSWTLTVELTFYALLPVLAWLAGRVVPTRNASAPEWLRARGGLRVLVPVVAMAGIGAAGHLWAASMRHVPGGARGWSADIPSVVSRSLLMQADLFALGMISALVIIAARRGQWGMRGYVVAEASAVLVAVAALTVFVGDHRGTVVADLVGAGFAALVVAILLPSTRGSVGPVGRVLESPVLRGLGLVSYSLYLWHMPVVRAMQHWFGPLGGGWGVYLLQTCIVLVVSTALATATYLAVERPALRLKARFAGTRAAAPALAARGLTFSADPHRRGCPAGPER
ncbi:hypothetical protein AX769_09865 [Frondihabitans sp. PAMC 28766]|uniref:acyltransferase family protein n=1 Tax=Frondihabitans sp. PAMC 28766 TaxID=1795630 RepID=UPI00078CC8AF|nr:acyltransferase [Frondihabitans sp. PAMC 28766]AMM20398.1 hypothetical protein AX769_09865 [Frondihabitans sp. PAMC 28766]